MATHESWSIPGVTALASRRKFLGWMGGAALATGLRVPVPFPGTVPRMHRAEFPADYVAGGLIQLNDNGAWSWFMDERAIVHAGKLVVGSVRSTGDRGEDNGNVELSAYDLAGGAVQHGVLHRHLQLDDHDNPALLVLPDDRLLAVYTKHRRERCIYVRTSTPGDPLLWTPASECETPGEDADAYPGDNVTYSNLFLLPSGRIIDLYRGYHADPNCLYSDDLGRSWRYGGRLLYGRDGYSPYLKYAMDGQGAIHFVATDDHPRKFDNSVYHGIFHDGMLHLSDGTPRGVVSGGMDTDVAVWDMTRVFAGDADHVAWVIDLELDAAQRPRVVFSVQRDGRGLPQGQGGLDLRYHYGRWDGSAWDVHEMAFAGTRLYPGEDDYPGLASLDPSDPNVVYISTNADPASGEPLVSSADGKRHYELYRGITTDAGAGWTWNPITRNSTADNLRPIVPKWPDPRTALIWMRGHYGTNCGPWTTAVVATILPERGTTPRGDDRVSRS